eukprot:scaffold38240_cov161-Skeletonema_dohrnii-CCMP3373.AAC.3
MEEQMIMVEDQSPPQSVRPSKQSSKSASQQEIYQDHDMSKSSTLQPTKSSSDTSQRAIHNDRDSSTSESELSVQLLNTTEEEVTDILEEMRFEFDFSEMDAGDVFTSMNLDANANDIVAAV